MTPLQQSILAIGEPPSAAAKIIKHFGHHDLEQLEATRTIRHDMNVVRSMAEKGRQNLKDLLLLEHAEIDGKETMKS